MPFIEAKLSFQTEKQDELQLKLSDAVAKAFSKPSAYIMSNIEQNCSMWMGNKKPDKCVYIAISLLGNASKDACASLTKVICDFLKEDFNVESNNVYITYHPTDLWGWNGIMF